MKLSKEQEDIFWHWINTKYNLLIAASAGSGKSFILLKLLEIVDNKTLFLAFNKSIQEDLQSKIDSRGLKKGKALTIHSLGLMAVRNFNPKIDIKNNKNFDLVNKLQKENPTYFKMKWEEKLKLTYSLLDILDISRMFLTDNLKEIKQWLVTMDKVVTITPKLEVLWKKLLKLRDDSYKAHVLVVDFLDMIYLPVKLNLPIPIDPTYLFIDEAQDLNLCQHKIIEKLRQQTVKRVCIVGDRKQSIYSFSGALNNSFDMFLDIPNTIELPLNTCYRCPKKVIDKANEVYDVMSYGIPNEGVIKTVDESHIENIEDKSMIVCRNSKPLFELYFQLLYHNKSCYIKGDDILESMIKFLTPLKYLTVREAGANMKNELLKIVKEKTQESEIRKHILREKMSLFDILSKHFAADIFTLVDTIIIKLKTLFFVKDDAIVLCTIHKAKGLEADIVYILNENLIPSKRAKTREQLIQEKNLKYVARTRAKNTLYFLNIDYEEDYEDY